MDPQTLWILEPTFFCLSQFFHPGISSKNIFLNLGYFFHSEIFFTLGYCNALAQPPLLWVCLPTSCSLDDLPKPGPARGTWGGWKAHTGDCPHPSPSSPQATIRNPAFPLSLKRPSCLLPPARATGNGFRQLTTL